MVWWIAYQVEQSTITDSSFKGRIVNLHKTTTAYSIGGLVGHLTGENASPIAKSKATIAISSNANSSDQAVGGLVGLVDNDAHVRDSYAEEILANVKQFEKSLVLAGYLWDRTSGKEQHAGSLTNVLSDVNVTNGNAITRHHYNNTAIAIQHKLIELSKLLGKR